jgi:ABC-2 type transport system permease protein
LTPPAQVALDKPAAGGRPATDASGQAPAADGIALARVLSRQARPASAGAASASLTMGWRALLKIKHVPFQLFDVTAFPLMMTVMFTYIFGGALSESPRQYLQYLIPGILVQAITFITVYTGVGLNTDITKGLFDRFRSLPVWQPAPIVGMLLGDVVRYSVASTMVVGLGVVLGFRPGAGLPGVLAAVLLVLAFAFSVSWIWACIGMVVKTPESVMTTSMLFLFPLTFVSNIFVDPETMPGWLETAVGYNPVSHLATASRGLMHGTAEASSILYVLAACALCVAVFAPLALRLYRKER